MHHRLLRVNRLLFLCFLGPEQLLQVAHLIDLGQSEDLVLLDDHLRLLHDLRQCIRRRLPLERCQPVETAFERLNLLFFTRVASDLVLGMRVQGLIPVEFSYVYVVLARQVVLWDDFA